MSRKRTTPNLTALKFYLLTTAVTLQTARGCVDYVSDNNTHFDCPVTNSTEFLNSSKNSGQAKSELKWIIPVIVLAIVGFFIVLLWKLGIFKKISDIIRRKFYVIPIAKHQLPLQIPNLVLT